METPTKNQTIVILFLLMVIGAIIRFWNLDFQSTNWDERFTISFAASSLTAAQIYTNSLTSDFTPPLYYLAAHFSMVLFGETPWAIRLPSVIAGILMIPAMYLVGKEYKDRIFGLLLAGLTTIFYNIYFYSKYGRSYSIALLWFSLSFYFFIRVIKGDKHSGVWFGLFAALCVWTHLYTAIPIGCMIIYMLWQKRAVLATIVFGAISLPLLSYINVILVTRCTSGPECQFAGTNSFGATIPQILFVTPIDIFGYSVIVILPILCWVIWTKRNEVLVSFAGITSLVVLASMLVLSFKTPMVLHYALFLVPMLLLVFLIPIHERIKNGNWTTIWILIVITLLTLECYQIWLINFVNRLGTF